jgi:hypothetical protein
MSKLKVPLAEITMARLGPEQLEKLKALEAELGGEVRLLAVEKAASLYALEAKISPQAWIPVHQVYPEIEGLRGYYSDREEAAVTKASLKSLLRYATDIRERKRPIRIRKL